MGRLVWVVLPLALAACESSSGGSHPCDGSACIDAGACPFDGGVDGGLNGGTCPSSWTDAQALCSSSTSCLNAGEECDYPGAGDFNGTCWATSKLLCVALDGGVPDAGGYWRCAQ
jgi:hypothetical protein